MANRTPKADGLALAPNAAATANDPAADPVELQVQRFWGRYTLATQLPNGSANVAGNPAYAAMRPGDVAWAAGALYTLSDRGTLSGGDAVWSTGGGGAPSLDLGALLWEWDPLLGVSQFEAAPIPHNSDFTNTPAGGNAASGPTLALTTLSIGEPHNDVLRLTAVSMAGGGVFPILASEITLPTRYVVVTQLASVSVNTINAAVYLFLDGTAGGVTFNGYMASRTFSSSGHTGQVIGGGGGLGRIITTGNSLATGGALNAAAQDTGGMRQMYTVTRPDGAATAYARLQNEERGGTQDLQYRQYIPSALAAVGAGWDSVDMSRVGIGAWGNTNDRSGVVDYSSFQIYAHPDD